MKKLFLLLLLPFCMSAQLQTSTLLNIYPVNVIPANYQMQPGPTNNNIISANFGDSIQAVIYLTWGVNTPTSSSFVVSIQNTYSPCLFAWTAIGSPVAFSALVPISTSTGSGYYRFKIKLSGFSPCGISTGYPLYQLKIGGTPNSSYNPTIPFTVYPLVTGIKEEEVKAEPKEIKRERYNLIGQFDEHGNIHIIYYSDLTVLRKFIYGE